MTGFQLDEPAKAPWTSTIVVAFGAAVAAAAGLAANATAHNAIAAPNLVSAMSILQSRSGFAEVDAHGARIPIRGSACRRHEPERSGATWARMNAMYSSSEASRRAAIQGLMSSVAT